MYLGFGGPFGVMFLLCCVVFLVLFNCVVVQVAGPWGSGLVVWFWLAGCRWSGAFGLVLGRSVVPGVGSCRFILIGLHALQIKLLFSKFYAHNPNS